jgi:acyl-coenzyme A synthetase/AMP-(fatty) acid ligase/acyl carrier protein
MARQCRSVPVEPVAAGDIALLGHTSGTTSRPKIVPYEQWRLAEAVRNRAQQCGFTDADRSLLLSPLFALGATRRSLVPPLLVGGSVICPTAVDGKSVVAILETMGPTQVVASPATLRSMLSEFERRRPRPGHTLRQIYSSFSELPARLRNEIEDAFSVPVLVNYGMSETGSIAETPLPPVSTPVGSVGRPTSLEVAVADEDGRRLGAGETGEIIVRGAEVMPGYENDEAANRQAFRDGWFRTGDAGWIDGDGFVYLSGRLKDIVNRGGMKIGPGEVANALARHPQVAEAAAFGMPHPTLGEDLAAAVVMRDGASAGEQALRDFLRTRLPPFKVPSLIFAVSEMPRGALDKTDRSELVRMARQRVRTDFEAPAAGIETAVASIFASVLDIAGIGRRDNFFHRGGDSLRGVRVVAAVEEAFGLAVSVDLLFDHPTVAAFAAELRLLLGLSADPAKPLPQEVPAGTSGTVAAACGVTGAADPTMNRHR